MRAQIVTLLLSFLLLPLPSVLAAVAGGPDDDGAWNLTFQVDHVGSVRARLDVLREDVDGAVWGARDLGRLELAGPTSLNVSFLPAEGSGRYTVGLVLEDARVDEVTFVVDDASASARVTFDVPDAPTWLNLTSDEVNANGKTKAPGEALLTRAILSDGNGLGDIDGVLWSIERANATVETGALPFIYAANATSAPLELRYERAPLAAGEHVVSLRAMKAGVVVASATRTFIIREVPPTFVSGVLPAVLPDENVTLDATIVLADRNGALGSGILDARVYRGSTRAEGAGLRATLGAPVRIADADNASRWTYPLTLEVPARATAGAHRVSLYHDDALLASLPFEVRALPTLRGVVATGQDARLTLVPNTTGEGFLVVRLSDQDGASTMRSAALPVASLELDAPRRGVPLRWSATLHAREGGVMLAERNGTWTAPLDGPALSLAAIHARPRLPAAWTVAADGWDARAANATFQFTRWDGAPEPSLRASFVDGKMRVEAPRDLVAGRYHGRLVLTWANGSASEASWAFDAGPWVELSLGATVVEDRNATVAISNTGGLAVRRVVVEAQPVARLALSVGNATHAPTLSRGRAVFSGFDLAPGESATLVVQLPEGPLPAGPRVIQLRVLARLEVA